MLLISIFAGHNHMGDDHEGTGWQVPPPRIWSGVLFQILSYTLCSKKVTPKFKSL